MSERITRLSPQMDFPANDLTDENATLLAKLFQNKHDLANFHNYAESQTLLYGLSHKTLNSIAKNNLSDTHTVRGIHEGIMAYEAIAAAVRPITPAYKEQAILGAHGALSVLTSLDRTLQIFNDEREFFEEKHPRTAETISVIVNRRLANAALAGAALARLIEIGAAERTLIIATDETIQEMEDGLSL